MNTKLVLSVLSLAVVLVSCASNSASSDADRVDLDSVFRGLHLDLCNAKCIEPLKPAFSNSLKLVNIYDGSEQMCKAYDEVLSCQKKNFCIKNQVFTVITSGLEDLCKTDKHTFVRDNEECIKPKIDAASQACNSKCHFVKEFADYSQDPAVKNSLSVLQVIDKLGGICGSLNCYLPCLRNGLNPCPRAGNVITSGILRPFYISADFIGKMAPNVQQTIASKLPKECAPLINTQVLNNITGTTN